MKSSAPEIADVFEQPAPRRLALTYRIRSNGKRELDREAMFDAAKLNPKQRVWHEQRQRAESKHCISIADQDIHEPFNPNIGAEDPMRWVMSFAKRCRRRYAPLFEMKVIAEHELFVGFFLQTPTEIAAVMLSSSQIATLQQMRFSLQMSIYQHEPVIDR